MVKYCMIFDILIPTMKTVEEYKATQFYKCISSIIGTDDHVINMHIKAENKMGLSELYQQHLSSSTADYVVFMHDDVEVHDHFIFDKLIKAHEQYDIVGLAGATTQDYSNLVNNTGQEIPLVWHLRRNKAEHSRGIVNHYIPQGFNGVGKTHINSAYFGPTPDEVCVIDGLFMSMKTSSLEGKGDIFDKDFTFHFYDMAMCVKAKRMGLTIGVWPIMVIHHGLGEFANDPTWHKLSKMFKEKYNTYKV